MSVNRFVLIKGFDKISIEGKKGVLIDMDNTLYPYDINHKNALSSCKDLCEVKYNIEHHVFDDAYKKARKEIHAILDKQAASHSRLLYFQRFHEILFDKTNTKFALDLEAHYWGNFLKGVELFREAEDFLIIAKNADLKVCIVTDLTAQIQMQKIHKLGLDKYIDYLVTSEEAGIEKPAALIFDLALSKLNLKAENVVMIGDNYKKDILGAQASNIQSYFVEPFL